MSNFSSISWLEQVAFNERMMSALYWTNMLNSASSLKQQSAGIHIAPLEHIILTHSQPFFDFTPKAEYLVEKQQIPISWSLV